MTMNLQLKFVMLFSCTTVLVKSTILQDHSALADKTIQHS